MSLPEPSAEANEDTYVPPNGHGEKLHDELVSDSPGEMSDSEVEEVEGDDAAHEEHGDDEEDRESEENDQANSEDDDDEEDEEDEDEDEDEEPALKYERIGGSVSDLLKKDSASALAISNKIMVRALQ
jgi:vacuolar protein sorting-associated protein 41